MSGRTIAGALGTLVCCTSSTLEPSHVLVAMGALTSGNIRVSLHRDTTEGEVAEFLSVLPGAVAAVRAELGAEGL